MPNKPMSAEKLEKLRLAVEDGWPLKQIQDTYGVGWDTLRKYFPDYRGMDLKQASNLGVYTRRMNKQIRKASYAPSATNECQPSYV